MFTMGPSLWGAAAGGDPLFPLVLGLFHFDEGDNVQAPFADSASFAGTQVSITDLQTKTADPKFGVSSLRRPATTTPVAGNLGDELFKSTKAIAIAADTPLTIECWARLSASNVGSTKLIRVYLRNGGGAVVNFDLDWRGTGDGSIWACNRNNSTLAASSTDAAPHAAYRHVALSVTPGGTGYFFVDGVQQASFAVASNGVADEAVITFFSIDSFGVAGPVLIDEARITLAARYAAAFTAPTDSFPDS